MITVQADRICKQYPAFALRDVSFSLEAGRIAGFVGRNGAGKTTTIKTMLGLVRPDSGSVSYFGMPFAGNEREIKGRIGYSTGTVCCYMRKKIRDILSVTKAFYDRWDEDACRSYMERFGLSPEKTPGELSEGMKVKLNLLIALSHRAELLILDEPTTGLDPFSREELLDVFRQLKEDGVTILFSTHIISDLEKAADDILYIREGQLRCALPGEAFTERMGRPGESWEETILRLERSDPV